MTSRARQPAEAELLAAARLATEPAPDSVAERAPAEPGVVPASSREGVTSHVAELAGSASRSSDVGSDHDEDDAEEVSPESDAPPPPEPEEALPRGEGPRGEGPRGEGPREEGPRGEGPRGEVGAGQHGDPARVEGPESEGRIEGSKVEALEMAGSEMTASEMAALGAATPEPPEPRAQAAGGASSDWPEAAPRPLATASRPPPPWIDEVPDPVTPYEQRVSETIKVADLPPAQLLRGRVLANRYLAEEVADHTATSLSYRAYHLALDRAVTVRILPRGLACTDEACQEVRRVAALASALGNPHIPATLDFGVLSDGWPFLVTEHFSGRTLAALSAAEGKFVLRRVLHIGKQLATGLSVAHEAGVTHGLLNPDNVLIVEPGSPAEVVKLLGFGVSRARGAVPGPPRSGVFGVPFYVSPEQASCRPLDARSDIYSVGVILYELMTGSPPFSDGDFASVLCQHLDDEAQLPSARLPAPGALAKAMDAVVERCLRKDPSKRYQSAAELRDDLIRLEAAAARTKRRPMPEVQRPTTTIHTPHPKAEGTQAPGAKVIVHGEGDAPPSGAPGGGESAATPPAPAVARTSSVPQTSTAKPAVSQAARVRVDQATIKISAMDRDLILGQRSNARALGKRSGAGGVWGELLSRAGALVAWLQARGARLVGVVRRFVATAQRRDDADS